MSFRLDYQKKMDGPVWSTSYGTYEAALDDAVRMDKGGWIPQSITDKDTGKSLVHGSRLATVIRKERLEERKTLAGGKK